MKTKIVHIALCGPVTDEWNYQDNILPKYHVKLGYEVSMITSQWVFGTSGKLQKDTRTEYGNSDGVKMIRLPLKGKDDFSHKFKSYRGLYTTLEKEKPDILFIHNITFVDIKIIVKYLKQRPGIRVFADSHNDFSNSATNWLSKNILHKIIWKHYIKKIEPYVTKFYGVLPARVDFLIDMYNLPKNKCELLLMGADDELVIKANSSINIKNIREKFNIATDDFLIMTGGKIDSWKTQTLLLMEAVEKIANTKVKLIVFGSVEDVLKEKMLTFCDGDKIQYIGWVQANQSYNYFAASNLVVFPGRHSIFWEQVTGQGIPMIVKHWNGTTHVDLNGNVKFLYEDSVDEIYKILTAVIEDESKYINMKKIASAQGMKAFSYYEIARRSIS
ncbi:glycosyltransferase [Pelosinus sp. sgz500959]|uniref:glycosyltransferase n=1 Tax=Pelosinus sp. sgz500959 TaxID=3242472 RepID=UPI0036713574